HRASGGITEQAFQLIAPVRRDLGVGVQGKPMQAGTAGTSERGRLALVTKARADASDLLASPLPKGEALLYRGRQRPGELGRVIDQGVLACRHRGVETRFQVPQMAELADDPPADLLEHVCDVGVGRWLDREKAWLEPLGGAIQIDPFKEDNMIMHIQI